MSILTLFLFGTGIKLYLELARQTFPGNNTSENHCPGKPFLLGLIVTFYVGAQSSWNSGEPGMPNLGAYL